MIANNLNLTEQPGIVINSEHLDCNIVTSNEVTGIIPKFSTIAILPFIKKEGEIKEFGLIFEKNGFRDIKQNWNLITGPLSPKMDTLEIARKYLTEQTGITFDKKENLKRFIFLGTFYGNKNTSEKVLILAVDISGIEIKTDLNLNPIDNKKVFQMVSSTHIHISNEMLIWTAYSKLFYQMFNILKHTDEDEELQNEDVEKIYADNPVDKSDTEYEPEQGDTEDETTKPEEQTGTEDTLLDEIPDNATDRMANDAVYDEEDDDADVETDKDKDTK